MSDEAFERRARELWKLYQAAYLKRSEQGDPYVSDCQKSALLAVADHVRREALEAAAKEAEQEAADDRYTDEGVCAGHEVARRIRALLPATKEGGNG